MENNTMVHVEPLTLWQCACRGIDLSKQDYTHVMSCPECETLATEIGDALDDLEKSLGRRRLRTAAS